MPKKKPTSTPTAPAEAQRRSGVLFGLAGLCGGLLVAGGFGMLHLMQQTQQSAVHAQQVEARAERAEARAQAVEVRAQAVEVRAQQVEAVLAEMRRNQDRYLKALEASLTKQPTIVVTPPPAPATVAPVQAPVITAPPAKSAPAPVIEPPKTAAAKIAEKKPKKSETTSVLTAKNRKKGERPAIRTPEAPAPVKPVVHRGPIITGAEVTRVLAVQQSHNRVMIDSGANDGLQPGMR
ncbi:MAG: hypothetical protein ACYTGH_00470, partial [Planctomycetota bacterium]